MNAADRIAYAERKLADAQKEAANAQAYLEWALGVAQDEIDKANSELVAPGALIADFGGKLYVSVKRAGFSLEPRIESGTGYTTVTSRAAELRCECGQAGEWSYPTKADVVVSRHWHSDSEAGRKPHLTIVHTALHKPPCDHWIRVPLKMDLA
ncbi:hypothetical protein [Nocardia sp. CA-290969]|uniref:hypothetical protein n=1 Tax=Nocardia sp. CA-290969 TaxID=3239986 RepID=UPI003D8A672D